MCSVYASRWSVPQAVTLAPPVIEDDDEQNMDINEVVRGAIREVETNTPESVVSGNSSMVAYRDGYFTRVHSCNPIPPPSELASKSISIYPPRDHTLMHNHIVYNNRFDGVD